MSSDDVEVAPDAAGSAPVKPKTNRHRTRRIIAAVLAVLAALMTTVAVTGGWLRRTTINTDRWVATVGPIASDPKVQAALAVWATDQLSQVVDTQAYFESVLPKKGKFLAGPLSGAIDQFLEKEVQDFLATDTFKKLWIGANRTAHDRILAVLRGNSDAITTQNGKVVLDLIPVMIKVLQQIDKSTNGLISSHVPDLNQNLTPAEARAKLSSALGRPIPNDFGTIAVFDDKQLSAVQDGVQWFQRGVIALWVVAILLIGAAVLVAPDRRRILIWLGLGIAVTIVAFRSISRATSKQVLNSIEVQRNRDAAQSVLHQVFASYRTLTAAVIALALVVALAAFLAGPSRAAGAVRGVFTRASWLSEYRTAAMVTVLVLALIAMLVIDLTFAALLVIVVIAGILEVVLWRLPAPPAPPSTSVPDAA